MEQRGIFFVVMSSTRASARNSDVGNVHHAQRIVRDTSTSGLASALEGHSELLRFVQGCSRGEWSALHDSLALDCPHRGGISAWMPLPHARISERVTLASVTPPETINV